MTGKNQLIRTLYLYIVALITLVMLIISTADLINLALKTWVFTKADREEYTSACPMAVPINKGTTSTEEATVDCKKFTRDEKERYQIRKQGSAVRDFSFILVALPLFLFHWQLIKKEKEEKENS